MIIARVRSFQDKLKLLESIQEGKIDELRAELYRDGKPRKHKRQQVQRLLEEYFTQQGVKFPRPKS
jgi:hypothetical protein